MAIILHVATQSAWDAARACGCYRAPSLELEGFIHCSTHAQVVVTANTYFRGRTDLVLLCIDEARLTAPVRYESPAAPDARTGQLFPHVYGPIAVDAVARVVPFPCNADGGFAMPADART
jgi:uncharacterized protein (DUF952 family)